MPRPWSPPLSKRTRPVTKSGVASNPASSQALECHCAFRLFAHQARCFVADAGSVTTFSSSGKLIMKDNSLRLFKYSVSGVYFSHADDG
jgi:hypothetical protein